MWIRENCEKWKGRSRGGGEDCDNLESEEQEPGEKLQKELERDAQIVGRPV